MSVINFNYRIQARNILAKLANMSAEENEELSLKLAQLVELMDKNNFNK